jgi:hypothetical protein
MRAPRCFDEISKINNYCQPWRDLGATNSAKLRYTPQFPEGVSLIPPNHFGRKCLGHHLCGSLLLGAGSKGQLVKSTLPVPKAGSMARNDVYKSIIYVEWHTPFKYKHTTKKEWITVLFYVVD